MTDNIDKDKLESLHLMASELLANSSGNTAADIRRQMAAVISGGYDGGDTLHNVYLDYGYPCQLKFSNFWNMYRRFGVAKNVIELPVDTGWMSNPIIEANEQFTKELDLLSNRVKLWTKLRGLDTRQRVGRYAGLFVRVRDNKKASEPLEGDLSGQAAVMELTPLYESQLEIIEHDNDPTSETFGQPKMIQYNQSLVGDRNEETNNTVQIHPSRIIFTSESADDGWIYGIPVLEPIYNSLMDLRKVIGGGAEGFYKNAAQSIVFDLVDPAKSAAYKDQLTKFNEQYDEFTQDRFRRSMWTPGMKANVLDSPLTDPKEFFNVALNDIAAGSQIPATILIGQQTGRLASDEDSQHFLSIVQSRREEYQTDLTMEVLTWLMDNGALPKSEIEITWDDLLARSDKEKLDNASKMAVVNKDQFLSGGASVFSEEEIREAGGYEPEELPDPGNEELDEEIDEISDSDEIEDVEEDQS